MCGVIAPLMVVHTITNEDMNGNFFTKNKSVTTNIERKNREKGNYYEK